jgi:DNA-binding response OmpR family regulator
MAPLAAKELGIARKEFGQCRSAADRIIAVAPLRASLSVLVVDDDPDTAESFTDLLALHGFTVRSAYCGRDALRIAHDDPPDVVLLDIVMPGMNGWELAQQLATTTNPPIIVAMTGCSDEEDRQRSNLVGIDVHLVKPVSPDILIRMMRRFARTTAPQVELRKLGETHPLEKPSQNTPVPQVV